MYTIFVVEDDKTIRDELLLLLERNGYCVKTSEDYEHMARLVVAANPSLVLLDLTLPVYDGLLVCREIRRSSDVPIMIVTSRSEQTDELVSLNLGADAFIAKPYNAQVLLAHIASLLRRAYSGVNNHCLSCAGISMDITRNSVTCNDSTVELSKNEARILYLLLSNPKAVVSRFELMDELWQSDEFVDDNTLTVNINRLRAKLASIGVGEDFIQTRRGIGYQIGLREND